MKLLVIDDDEPIRKVLSVTLQDAGYQVLTAEDGETGLKIFADQQPEIILCDLRMPGMDGIAVLKEIVQGLIESGIAFNIAMCGEVFVSVPPT